jgi:D-arabinose 1-dehydrogenase-like Zn-dependent alcohol dehydrogenase
MLAARLDVKTLTLSLEDIPIPEPGPGQVRIKVRAGGVCLSDVHLTDGSVRPLHLRQNEVTLGHEIAGTIHAVGPGAGLIMHGLGVRRNWKTRHSLVTRRNAA